MTAFAIGLPVAGFFFALRESNFAGQVIILALFVGSIFAWSVMTTKMKQLRRARRATEHFLRLYETGDSPVSFLADAGCEASPLHSIYTEAREALDMELTPGLPAPADGLESVVHAQRDYLTESQVTNVENVIERVMASEVTSLERGMVVLATAETTAPFLGLLGTVWGVMIAFGGMVIKKTAQLTEIAPGIAGALVTTVVGLLVALPSAIGYSFLRSRITDLCGDMDDFSSRLLYAIRRHYLRPDGSG